MDFICAFLSSLILAAILCSEEYQNIDDNTAVLFSIFVAIWLLLLGVLVKE